MLGFVVQPLSTLWGKILIVALPWLQRFIFNSVVKKASKGALKKTPLSFYAPNIIASLICVLLVNGVHFTVTLWFTDGVAVSLISAGSVTLITAFFLLRGFFCEHTKRERIILLCVLFVFFGLFVVFQVVVKITWLALVIKLTLEVIFCFAVMLSELNQLDRAQSKVIMTAMKKLRISPDKFIGKMILKFFGPKTTLDNSVGEEDAPEDSTETEDIEAEENENAITETQ